ncbi:MAG: HYR domain-containing protein [Acidobacteria bacterium]|nr:HYR domain-containing protein [Acidobacteriota bacterium]
MISRRVLILLLLVAAASTLTANGELQAPDNKGTDFFLAFPQNGDIVRLNVTGAADNGSGLIRITTLTPHGFLTGNFVVITGVLGTTEANGTWQITTVAGQPTKFDLQGSSFVNAYVTSTTDFADRAPTLTLFIANEAPTDATVEISSPGFLPFPVPITASSVVEVPINPIAQITTSNAVSEKGIRVRSVDPLDSTQEGLPIAVYAWSRRPFAPGPPAGVGDGAYVALPVDVLGNEYLTVSQPGSSQVTVVATQDQTTVQITQPTGGTPQQILLDQGYAYVLQQAADLTGALVTADKPIAVFSGNQSGTVLSISPDHMIEQMVPVSTLGTDFLVTRTGTGASNVGDTLVRVVAREDNTEVWVDGELKATKAAGTFHEFTQSPSSHNWVSTTKPTVVAQYKRGDTPATDPFLMLVPPVNQYSREYLFRTPGAPFSNFLNIVVKEGDQTNLGLDGDLLPTTTVWTSVNGYAYARVAVAANAQHLLWHTDPTVHFGAWVYGHAQVEGFGFAAGQLVADMTPPVIAPDSVPQDNVQEATGPGGAVVTWNAPTATDFGRGELPVICNPASGSEIPLGTQIVECSATDPAGNTATASFNVTVQDTTTPALQLPAVEPVHATGPNGATVSYVVAATDLVDQDVTVVCTPASGSVFPLNQDRLTQQTRVSCVAADDSPDSPDAVGEFTVTVTNSAPICTTAVPSIPVLWPPLKRMVPISIHGVADPDGDSVSIVISRIFQDEPVRNGRGPRRWLLPDGDGVGTAAALVRAERSGRGNGRVYHIGFTATDSIGASCTGEVTVSVPHNRRRPAVDEGALYDSTVVPVIVRPHGDHDADDDEEEEDDED